MADKRAIGRAIALRLAANASSVLEGVFIFVQLTVACLVLGLLWAAREIYDSWILE